MNNKNTDYLINSIQDNYGVSSTVNGFDAGAAVKKIVSFLKHALVETGKKGYVLGISGGVDSTCAGRLSAIAVDELNSECGENTYHFYAVRLPYGVQADESDVDLAMLFINPTEDLSINIKDSTDSMHQSVVFALGGGFSESKEDFNKGNVKARARMMAQYEIAGLTDTLVVGTDHRSEYITGFFTKWGDGACDIAPLSHLNKRKVRAIAQYLCAPEQLFNKVPTADLEDGKPQVADEVALQLSYNEIDDVLEGNMANVSQKARARIAEIYSNTKHKRKPPMQLKR
ncbi:ammonia-dependent NAD(+) synthetase [Photobacterium kishitanii]|uniref:NH(3)-dependent NAD(+) synthetase n=1 Tax=Photobacterium kishitanii TaxID=318456 RepID=A0A2T3KLI0_9GAMM|nr:ammonia-dependent NAD(+) synthetase [Photobacterium kishitanii]PSV00536.1 NAD(+) synthase [Photobacterium kishitanii]